MSLVRGQFETHNDYVTRMNRAYRRGSISVTTFTELAHESAQEEARIVQRSSAIAAEETEPDDRNVVEAENAPNQM